jgi:hypothetical protein
MIKEIETFNSREQLRQAEGEPGKRIPEDMEAIRHQLGALLRHTADHVYPVIKDNPDIFDRPEILDLLTDIEALSDEFTQYYYSQIKLKEDDYKRKFEAERQRNEGRFVL